MKHVFTHLAFLCLFGNLFAQQDPQFTQYMHNKLFINPGYAGMKHALCFTGIVRDQWSGFNGAPRSGVFSGDIYLEDLYGGVGLNLMYDQLGFERNFAYRINYSYHLEKILGGTLGIGLEAGGTTKNLGPGAGQDWVSTTNWMNDPTIPPQMKASKGDFGAGIWYERDDLFFGISTTHFTGGKFDAGSANVGLYQHALVYDVAPHYWITGGYTIPTAKWEIQPSFLIKTDAVVTTFDINCIATYNSRFWCGVSYRHQDAVCPMIGFNWTSKSEGEKIDDPENHDRNELGYKKSVSNLRMGFAYDITTSKLNSYSNGTFELFVNYCIPWTPRIERHGDTRIWE